MANIDRRGALAGLGMLVIAATGAAASPRRRLAEELPALDLEAEIPRQFDDWVVDQTIVPILPAPDVQDRLDKLYSHVLSRSYVNSDGNRIMFVIAYGADQADRTTLVHLPQSCYSSQGFSVSAASQVSIAVPGRSVDVVRLSARRGSRVEPITYWTTVGERAYSEEVNRRWARAWYALRGIIPDGMLVRVSSIDANITRAFDLQAFFVARMYANLTMSTRARVFGAAA